MSDDAATASFGLDPPAQPAGIPPACRDSEVTHQPGETIGHYEILEVLGEGGFGVVYLAEQTEPVRRRVALKIIKPGMDSKAVIARFEAERQALAMMSHPNVAKVLDAGAVPIDRRGGGRPYFVMEHIKGAPITDYCDTHRLTIEQRLKLFAVVCDAVQHAHMKGIVHRDLKPGNILVAIAEGDQPRPVVIDFGVAKALAGRLSEQTIFTARGQLIGTPEYMSPEQAEMAETDIDTRSDVYSLGVILYELLSGAVPFDSRKLRAAGIAAIQKMIREAEPPRPSMRLSTIGESNSAIAAARQTVLNDLASTLRRELEWIPLKALRKDRTERYRSASELADDVANYLAHRPLIAGPEATGYKVRKFVRRNKGTVAAAGVIAATLVAATGVSVWFGLREARQRAEADRQTALAEASAEQARKQQAVAEAVTKFQADMLAAVDPRNLPKDPVTGEPLKDAVTVLQAIQAAASRLDEGSLKEQPLVEASVRNTIGITLLALARYDDANRNLRKCLEIRRSALPAGHPDIAMSLNDLGLVLSNQNKFDEAEPLLRQAIADWRACPPAEHSDIAFGLGNLASLLQAQNKLVEAEPLFREALEIRRASLPAAHPRIGQALNNLAYLMVAQRKLAEAEPLYREALAIYRVVFPAGNPEIAIPLDNLAGLLEDQNKLVEAEPLQREALAIRRAALPVGHVSIGDSLNNLGKLLHAQNKLTEAEPLLREALAIYRAGFPVGHPHIAVSLGNLAHAQQALGKTAEARAGFDEAISILRRGSPNGSPFLARALCFSGSARLENKDAAAALPELEEAVAMAEKVLPGDHAQLKEYREALAKCKMALGR